MDGLIEFVTTEPPPETIPAGLPFQVKGNTKLGPVAPPLLWAVAYITKKEWYAPEFFEPKAAVWDLPNPFSGDFSIGVRLDEEGVYSVRVALVPFPYLPVRLVPTFVIAQDETLYGVTVGPEEEPESELTVSSVSFEGG